MLTTVFLLRKKALLLNRLQGVQFFSTRSKKFSIPASTHVDGAAGGFVVMGRVETVVGRAETSEDFANC